MGTLRYTVLVVDDDPMVRNLILNILMAGKHACESAADGIEALDKISRTRYDAVITDISMPNMNGIILTKELTKQYPDIPVLVVTGFTNIHTDEEALNAGAVDFIKKPFSAVEFSARFQKMMHNHEIISALKAQQEAIEKEVAGIITAIQSAPPEEIEILRDRIEELKRKFAEK